MSYAINYKEMKRGATIGGSNLHGRSKGLAAEVDEVERAKELDEAAQLEQGLDGISAKR